MRVSACNTHALHPLSYDCVTVKKISAVEVKKGKMREETVRSVVVVTAVAAGVVVVVVRHARSNFLLLGGFEDASAVATYGQHFKRKRFAQIDNDSDDDFDIT